MRDTFSAWDYMALENQQSRALGAAVPAFNLGFGFCTRPNWNHPELGVSVSLQYNWLREHLIDAWGSLEGRSIGI